MNRVAALQSIISDCAQILCAVRGGHVAYVEIMLHNCPNNEYTVGARVCATKCPHCTVPIVKAEVALLLTFSSTDLILC